MRRLSEAGIKKPYTLDEMMPGIHGHDGTYDEDELLRHLATLRATGVDTYVEHRNGQFVQVDE